ncbi:hypothetical protein GGF32_004030 [Allomyces javanicus]|nr:hypothetical protein GGF32_004030 [Allomyces javanicus]
MAFRVSGTVAFLDTERADAPLLYPFTLKIWAPSAPVQQHDFLHYACIRIPHMATKVVRDLVMTVTVKCLGKIVLLQTTSVVPAPLGFPRYLHDPNVCDCPFLTKGTETPMYASRVMLMRASATFSHAASTKNPTSLKEWDAPAVALALQHIYSGWTPNTPLPMHTPDELLANFA